MWPWSLLHRKRRQVRLALVTCVRNEAAWLPAFLHYHHAIGVERAYVFLDRCSDASEEIARSFSWTRTFRVDPQEAVVLPYVCDVHAACMNRARALARVEGFDWLLTIDPDEFACADNPQARSAIARAHLQPLLGRVPADTLQIQLPTRELVPTAGVSLPYWRQRFFQTAPALTYTIHDPRTGRSAPWREFLGHRQGKSIIRTDADVQAYDSHRWVPEQEIRWPQRPEYCTLPGESLGYHLHYYVTSQAHWREKFPKHAFEPARWFCGSAVELPKQCWKEMSARLSEEHLQGYFERWIARSEDEARALAERGLLQEDSVVAQVLHEAGVVRGNSVLVPQTGATSAAPEPFAPLTDSRLPTRSEPAFAYPTPKIPRADRRGFHGLERSGTDYFRWTEPQAALQVRIPPGDYQLRLDMKHLAHHWHGTFQVRINDRPVPARNRRLCQGTLMEHLKREDFPAADKFWLQLEFQRPPMPPRPSADPRALGAPLFGIFLDPC